MSNKKIKNYFLFISGICIIVFIIQLIIPGFTELFILNDKANNGEIWRFVTAIFLHGSFSHLLYNLIALLFFGMALEKLIGSKRFLIVFFASGIIANLVANNFYESSLGASGAIYGIIGALTIIKPLMIIWAFGLMMPLFIASVLWIIGDILRDLGAFGPTNIGSVAHISGILIGFVIGIYWKIKKKSEELSEKEENVKVRINEKNIKEWEEKFLEG